MVDQEIKVVDFLEGATSLLEAATMLAEKSIELVSLAGRGYRIKDDEFKDGYGFLIRPDNTLVNDRDRLATALMDLSSKHQYETPMQFAWEAHCVDHAAELLEEKGIDADKPLVFWVSEADDEAFGYQGWSQEIIDKMPEDVDEREAWFEENTDYVRSQEISERLSHHTLVEPLPLHWRGDVTLIISVLREHGLEVVEPESDDMCVMVLPGL